MRQQLFFTIAMLVVGVFESAFAFAWVGSLGVEGVFWSLLLCSVPGWLTIFASDLMKHRDLGPYVVLVGTGLRVVFAFLGLFVVSTLRPDLGFREFIVWLITGYLAALAVETWLLVDSSKTVG